jgi:hypothetical protein
MPSTRQPAGEDDKSVGLDRRASPLFRPHGRCVWNADGKMKSSLRRKKVKWARRGGHALPKVDRLNKDVEEVIEDEEDAELKNALRTCTDAKGKGMPTLEGGRAGPPGQPPFPPAWAVCLERRWKDEE